MYLNLLLALSTHILAIPSSHMALKTQSLASPTTLPDFPTTNHTLPALQTVPASDPDSKKDDWIIWYCNGAFNESEIPYASCTGDCTEWTLAKQPDGDISAPETNCLKTWPPYQPRFKVCAGPTGLYRCNQYTAFNPWLDRQGWSIYNTQSTGGIYVYT